MAAERNDKAIVSAVLSGNSEAYGEIVHRYKDVVFNAVYAIIKNHHTSEDLTQDTFVDGYIKLKSLGEPYNVSAWLIKIAKNKCYNYMTRSALRFESELHDFMPDPRTPTPETLFIEQQDHRSIREAVNRLPESHRSVAVMYYFENYTHNKIALALNIPIGTVKSRLYDARLKLKKELSDIEMNDMINKNETIKNVDFEKEVAKRIKLLEDYYHLNNFSMDGIDKKVNEFIQFIDEMPESKLKHKAYAAAYQHSDKEEYKSQALKQAELGENADIYFDAFWDKYANTDDDAVWLKAIDSDEGLAKIEKMENSDNAVGAMLFWRGACNLKLKNLKEARKDFEKAQQKLGNDNSYHPNAVSAIKVIDVLEPDFDNHLFGYNTTGERYRLYDGGKQLDFVNQPGFGSTYPVYGINTFESIYYYSTNGRKFFDLNTDFVTETVTTLAGTFENCIHTARSVNEEYWKCTVDAWYAKGVGLVKVHVKQEGHEEEIYELCEYKAVGDKESYMPATIGNFWRYKNVNLSDFYHQVNEYEITNVIDEHETGSTYIYLSHFSALKVSLDNCDSDTHIALADEALPDDADRYNWDFDTAIKNLRLAVQKNSSARATSFALSAIEFLERFKEYKSKDYRVLVSSVNGSLLKKSVDKISFDEARIACISLNDWGAFRIDDEKVFGTKIFRYLQVFAGTIYSGKWVSGYSEQRRINVWNIESELSIKAEDGGTVKVKAGTFENCIKVTFDFALPEGKKYFWDTDGNHPQCGTKIYYYAPGVGIVKHENIWGDLISSTFELTEYNSVATGGEYMPIYIGNRWIYDEMTIEPEYIARMEYSIVSGTEDEFVLIINQEFVYKDTFENYEEFRKSFEK